MWDILETIQAEAITAREKNVALQAENLALVEEREQLREALSAYPPSTAADGGSAASDAAVSAAAAARRNYLLKVRRIARDLT